MSEAQESNSSSTTCPFCLGTNPADAQFCKACGAAISPPSSCPSCGASIPNDARFCPSCGIRVIGPRSEVASGAVSTQTAVSTPVSKEDGAKKPTLDPGINANANDEGKDSLHAGQPADADALEALSASNEKRRRNQGVGLGTNVLFFVSVLVAFIVAMYAWNKDKPKEASMFSGAPSAPPAANTPPQPAQAGPGETIAGEISIDAVLASQVDTSGVLYIIVRNAGMPTQGPPLAVRKFSQPRFPMSFSVGSANVMMKGLPFAGPFDVYVRLDRDGNAMTKGPEDLIASAPPRGVSVGDQSLNIKLDQTMVQNSGSAKKVVPTSPVVTEANNSEGFSGQITVDGSLGSGSGLSEGTIYIIVRPGGMPPVGPPLAVRKYDRPSFPLPFNIGPEHVMMKNMPFTGPFDVYVRWDRDGNAMTKEAGDLECSKPSKNVSKGVNSLVLVLDEKRK